ncbi:conserved hypothetical protein [Verrucomicrobia bacterium]|nr:conserved hypothetical protein [Verrucomicrobiota bacterium]
MCKKSVYCIASSEAQASDIISLLRNSNFSNNDISALLPDKTGTKDFGHEHHTKALEGAALGGLIGLVACGGVGWLAALGFLPWPGSLLAAGPAAAALGGAGIGAALGGVLGAFVGWGIPEYEAKRYEGKIREGNILISVHCEREEWVEQAKDIFERAGARGIAASGEAPVSRTSRQLLQDAPRPA